jgi:hypothetical protein
MNGTSYSDFFGFTEEEVKSFFKNAKTKEEQDFYMTLSNMVLQKQQKKVIGS